VIVPTVRERYSRAFIFLPDNVSRAKLPAATGTFKPLPVDAIDLDKTPSELLPDVIGTQATKKVLFGGFQHYGWPAELTIKAFGTSIDCDHRSYFAEVESIRSLRPKMVALKDTSLFGC
jgi:hypothetical protein